MFDGRSSLRRKTTAMVCAVALLWAPGAAAQSAPSPDPDPWFGTDKALHFSAGFVLGVGGYALGAGTLGGGTLDSRLAGALLGTGIVAAIGGAKEGIDATGVGDPSIKDFVWDMVGGLLGIGISLTFDAALRGPEGS
ncbi:MAG: hypothetical protein KC731_16655 [Myxococcales bacterium]|nr:hypothetical protein [Myxococcales bacterium]